MLRKGCLLVIYATSWNLVWNADRLLIIENIIFLRCFNLPNICLQVIYAKHSHYSSEGRRLLNNCTNVLPLFLYGGCSVSNVRVCVYVCVWICVCTFLYSWYTSSGKTDLIIVKAIGWLIRPTANDSRRNLLPPAIYHGESDYRWVIAVHKWNPDVRQAMITRTSFSHSYILNGLRRKKSFRIQ